MPIDESKLPGYERLKVQKLNLNIVPVAAGAFPGRLKQRICLISMDTYITADGTDARNYGIGDGIPECRKLFAELLGLQPQQIIYGREFQPAERRCSTPLASLCRSRQ
ncbi:MAG: hypothetical protein ACLTLQ_14570 [[Clostridium] scindens]